MKIFSEKIFEEKIRVGLEIGASSIKVAQIKETPKGIVLLKAGYKEIPPLPAVDPSELEYTMVQTLKELWKELKLKPKIVKLIISDPTVYSRHISVPRVAEDELVKAIKWQAEKYVPFSIDDAVVDYQTLDAQLEEGDTEMGIVLVAAEKNTVSKYLSVLKAAKLTPVVLDFSPFAVAKAVLKNYSVEDKEILPVVDIGSERSSIIVVRGEGLVLTRNIDLAGRHFTEAIADEMGIDTMEAEKIKKEFDIYPGEGEENERHADIFSSIEPALADLVAQINRSFAYCERECPVENIDKVLICGGGANLKGLDKYLSEKLKLPVEVATSFKNLIVEHAKYNAEMSGAMPSKLMGVVGEVL